MKHLFVTLALAVPVVFLAATADAQYDDVRQRAACAQVEMAEAMGDPVSPEEKRQCQAMPKKPPAPRPQGKGEVVFSDAKLKELPVEPKTCGAWIRGQASQGDVLYGVGIVAKGEVPEPKLVITGMQRALLEIAAQVSTQINGSLYMDQAAHTAYQDNNGRTSTQSQEYTGLSESARMMVGGSVDDARMEDQCRDAKGTFYVLMSLDMAKVAEREGAVVASVIQSLTDATLRAAAAMNSDQFTQELLIEILDTLEQANAMGRSKIGHKVKDQWQKEYDGLLRLAKRMYTCLEVEGGYAPNDNKTLLFKTTCNGIAIRDGKYTPTVDGGIVDLPEVLTTGPQGVGKVKVGETFGQGTIKIALAHDVSASRGAQLVRSTPKNQLSRFEIEATSQPTASIKVSGLELSFWGQFGLKDAVESWASRKWGATIVDGGGKLKIDVVFNLNPTNEVMGKKIAPVGLVITVSGPRGKLFEKEGRNAGQGATEREAREQSFKNIVRNLKDW